MLPLGDLLDLVGLALIWFYIHHWLWFWLCHWLWLCFWFWFLWYPCIVLGPLVLFYLEDAPVGVAAPLGWVRQVLMGVLVWCVVPGPPVLFYLD